MFDIGKKYWFVFKGDTKERVTLKGEVVEENDSIIKVKRDNGLFSFILINNIISVNEARS